jgi:(4S)-4-hydroxy-5-phosphonooxypentane-2,3-dione isomerase
MPKLALIATFEAAEGRRDDLASALKAHGARCLKDEPGTLHFEVLVPRDDEAKVLVYEVYRDDAAFDEHRKGASVGRFRDEANGTYGKFQVTRCTPLE